MIPLLLTIIILALILGLAWWAVTLLPIPPPILRIVQVAIIVLFIIALLSLLFGLVPGTGYYTAPRL